MAVVFFILEVVLIVVNATLKKLIGKQLALLCLTGMLLMVSVWPLASWAESNTLPKVDSTSDEVIPELKKPTMFDVDARRRVGLNHIFYFEDSPLGDRIPVILMPGRAEEYQQSSWWKKIWKRLKKDDEFQSHYKLYAFIYDSKHELDEQSVDFNNEVKRHFGYLGATQPLVLVTYSLGGVIAYEALADEDVMAKVHTVFGIAVPYHGSPMFDPSWFGKYLRPRNRSPIRKAWDRFIYHGYMFGKTNLKRGLKWDNFDGSKPQFDNDNLELQGDQVVHAIEPFLNREHTRAFKDKLVIYASYLENGYTKTNQPLNPKKLPLKVVGKTANLPKDLTKNVLGAVLPFYGYSVHSVFTYMNHQLSNLPTFTPEFPKGENTHTYRFNDGALPLSSMMFLPPSPTPYEGDLNSLLESSDVCRIRLFVNVDHMHIGQYSIRKSRLRSDDILSDAKEDLTPNHWIIDDLKTLYETDLKALHTADDDDLTEHVLKLSGFCSEPDTSDDRNSLETEAP